MRVLVQRMRQHPRPDGPRGFHTIGFTQGWQTSAVTGTIRKAFWHALRCRRNLVMVSVEVRQCFDHIDVRRGDVARELNLLRDRARIADADWTQVESTHQHFSTNFSSTISHQLLNSGTRSAQVTSSGATATIMR